MYLRTSSGSTIASESITIAGAAIRATALKASMIQCASGRFWQFVPRRFHRNATASSLSTSTPWLARNSISSTIRLNTTGFS